MAWSNMSFTMWWPSISTLWLKFKKVSKLKRTLLVVLYDSLLKKINSCPEDLIHPRWKWKLAIMTWDDNTLFQSHAIEDGYDGYEMPIKAPQVIIVISRVTALVCGGSWNEGLRWSIGETNLTCFECFCSSNTTLSSWPPNTSFQKPGARQFFRFLFFKSPELTIISKIKHPPNTVLNQSSVVISNF